MTTCKIEGCDGPVKTRGWCQAHYARWLRTGDTGPADVVRRSPGRACSVAGCSRKHQGRGYCDGHLRRVIATGEPGPAEFEPRRPKGDKCSIEGCDRLRYAKDVCDRHYQRLRKYGTLDLPSREGSATYNAVHLRLRAQRGAAKDSTCPCGAAAEHWAYVRGDDQSVRYDEQGRPYSTDLSRYEVLCRTCHCRMDAEATRTYGCSVPGCDGTHKARGMCNRHYRQALKG